MDKEKFRALAEKYRDMVYRVALNFFKNIQDAEDAMQEALIKLYLRGEPFETDEHARNWLIRVTLNHCKSVWRSERRSVSVEELSEAIPFETRGESELFQSVMALSDDYRTALYLFYYEELSVREIAGLLDLSETAVTTRLSRARKMLKHELMEATTDGI